MERTERIIIAGSRNFNDFDFLCKEMDSYLSDTDNVAIISGAAKGADMLGERYAKERHLRVERYPADWNKYGKSAGSIRNKEMAKNADTLIAFWDSESRGTKNMIDLANEHGLLVKINYFE